MLKEVFFWDTLVPSFPLHLVRRVLGWEDWGLAGAATLWLEVGVDRTVKKNTQKKLEH